MIRLRSDSRNIVEVLSLAKNKWSTFDPGPGERSDRDQPAIDVQGRERVRALYVLSWRRGAVLRYSIAKEGIVETIPVPRAARLPQGSEHETHLTFDPINRVLLYPNTVDYGGRVLGLGIYHGDTKKSGVGADSHRGHPVEGNVGGFDVGNNVMMLYGGKREQTSNFRPCSGSTVTATVSPAPPVSGRGYSRFRRPGPTRSRDADRRPGR